MDAGNNDAGLYQVFQETFNKQVNYSEYPNQQQQHQQHVWSPPPPTGGSYPYTGAELDFPVQNEPGLAPMRPPTNFYGQEFCDMNSQPQPPQMQAYYESAAGMMGYHPAAASPAGVASWPQQPPIPTSQSK